MAPPGHIGPLKRLWIRWKSLELPWRKYRLAGMDLAGTTYWEFRPAAGMSASGRMRRIAQHPRSRHYADVAMSPAWLQWLRHTRDLPPTLDEQRADVLRQANLKQLARQADERWAAKDSFLDAPKEEEEEQEEEGREVLRVQEGERKVVAKDERTRPPAAARQRNPGDEWQPRAWSPGGAKKKEG